jgi:hypothetical protein
MAKKGENVKPFENTFDLTEAVFSVLCVASKI